MRENLEALVVEKSLNRVSVSRGSELLDAFPDLEEKMEIKNVCAKVPAWISADIEEICGILDIRKRRFIEAALLDAIARAQKIMADEGVYEALNDPKEGEQC